MTKKYDLCIVGGGIAGLSIGEIFARSGLKVVILEKNEKLCMGDSGAHHEWFHFGSLYSIFPNNQALRTLVGGIDDLLVYYRDFEGMNLHVTNNGRLISVEKESKWYREDFIEYVVSARNDPDFSLKNFTNFKDFFHRLFFLLTWETAIKQFISRHSRFYKYDWRRGTASFYIPRAGIFDYSRSVIEKFRDENVLLDPDTHFGIRGYDRPMNAYNIISDLTRSYLSYGGEIQVSTEYKSYRKRDAAVEIKSNLGTIETDKLILAMGKDIKGSLQGGTKVSVFVSPLLVVYPHVCDRNFVRLTPFMTKTINHLKHSIEGKVYSLIGGGYFADPSHPEDVDIAGKNLMDRANTVFPRMKSAEIVKVYFGNKTEIVQKIKDFKKRNYLYRMEKVDDDVYFVIPGKFSLGFSLAVNTFKEIMGHYPSTTVSYNKDMDVSSYVGYMKHKNIILNGG